MLTFHAQIGKEDATKRRNEAIKQARFYKSVAVAGTFNPEAHRRAVIDMVREARMWNRSVLYYLRQKAAA